MPNEAVNDSAPSTRNGLFDVVVFDYEGVCTPSPREFIESGAERLSALRPELGAVITKLRNRGTVIALLSNEFDRSWASTIDDFPSFDHVILGSDNQIYKPDRRAFQRVLHNVGCEAEKCLVIDDDVTNCRVARSIGCRTVHFDTTDIAVSWASVLAARATVVAR